MLLLRFCPSDTFGTVCCAGISKITIPVVILITADRRAKGGLTVKVRGSGQKVLRHCAAIFRELLENGLVEPDVHRCGISLVSVIAQFIGHLLPGGQAGFDAHEFHQIDNRLPPVE